MQSSVANQFQMFSCGAKASQSGSRIPRKHQYIKAFSKHYADYEFNRQNEQKTHKMSCELPE